MKIRFCFYHPEFSWLINKNPASKYGQKLNTKFDVEGYFIYDKVYAVDILPNEDAFIQYAKDFNLDKWLIAEKYLISPLNITVLDKVFRDPLRSRFNIDYNNEPHKCEIGIEPIVVYDTDLLIDLFNTYFPGCEFQIHRYPFTVDQNKDFPYVAHIYFNGYEKIDLFLKKIFVLLFAYTSVSISERFKPDEQQLKKYLLFIDGWLDEKSKYYNLITKRLGGNGFGASFLKNKGEATPFDQSLNYLSNQRYNKIVEVIPEGAAILDIGCNNGKLASKIYKTKRKQITSYMGIDGSSYAIQKARGKVGRSGNFKFAAANLMYMDHMFWDNANFIIMTEVLEHLEDSERLSAIKFLVNNCADKTLLITVPNYAVNDPYWNLGGEYRHSDHKIEYTLQGLNKELVEPFEKAGYTVQKICISDELICFDDQISFMLLIKK